MAKNSAFTFHIQWYATHMDLFERFKAMHLNASTGERRSFEMATTHFMAKWQIDGRDEMNECSYVPMTLHFTSHLNLDIDLDEQIVEWIFIYIYQFICILYVCMFVLVQREYFSSKQKTGDTHTTKVILLQKSRMQLTLK